MKNKRPLSIYIHIPFCIKKCLYCDFLSFASSDAGEKSAYVKALLDEIHFFCAEQPEIYEDCEIVSMFFGGGTPSIMSVDVIEKIMTEIRQKFDVRDDAEITLECNPKTATEEKLEGFKALGINRLSIGLQSSNDEELKLLGRVHDYKDFIDTYNMARECGFENINVDIMSAIPGQTFDSYKETLEKVVGLDPEHISAYSLIIEDDTPFALRYEDGRYVCMEEETFMESDMPDLSGWPDLPDEDTEREMYYFTEEYLNKHGYHRYEISNYAKDNRECLHNRNCWECVDYIGFGIGAASLFKGVRYTNTDDIVEYVKECKKLSTPQNPSYYEEEEEEEYPLKEACELLKSEYRASLFKQSDKDRMEEYMFLGLRKTAGVTKSGFYEKFHVDIEDIYGGQIEKLVKEGHLAVDNNIIMLTKTGIDFSNKVLANFLL